MATMRPSKDQNREALRVVITACEEEKQEVRARKKLF